MSFCTPNTTTTITTVNSTVQLSNSPFTNAINVTIIPGTVQKFRIKYFAVNIPAISLSPTLNYVLNVDVSYLDIQNGILDVQLLPVSSTSQSPSAYTFVSGNYLDVNNTSLQVYLYVSTNNASVPYNEQMILYITYY